MAARLKRRLCRSLFWLYLVACLVTLALVPATGAGFLPPNPFVALPAVVLGLPWSPLATALAPEALGVAGNMALIAAGMALNLALLRLLCRRLGRG
jgi:hypothetical protein